MTPDQLLGQALEQAPARVLLTYYDDATGERTELSVVTFANWVAKTANLLRDGLAVQPGDRVAILLPCHWQSAVWLAACWATGAVAAPDAAEATVSVVRLDDHPTPPAAAGDVVALGLGPMGLPQPGRTPAAATLDYDREIHSFGDRFVISAPVRPDSPALLLAAGSAQEQTVTAADLVERAATAAAAWALAPGDRVLCTQPLTELTTILGTTLVPLVADLATVLSRHTDPTAAADRVLRERVTGVVGPVTSGFGGLRRLI